MTPRENSCQTEKISWKPVLKLICLIHKDPNSYEN